jgi:hypothetical protein
MRIVVVSVALACALAGANKKQPPAGRGESESVEVTATLYTDKDDIKQRLGDDLEGHYTVLDVRIASRFGREIDVHRDDFLLRTDKDGERSTPFTASQIAGQGALVVTRTASGGSRIGIDVWGGGVGNGGSVTEAQAKLDPLAGQKGTPLEKTLAEKTLPEGKTDKSLSGLLYFPLEKQKPKDLELIYSANDGKIRLRFK